MTTPLRHSQHLAAVLLVLSSVHAFAQDATPTTEAPAAAAASTEAPAAAPEQAPAEAPAAETASAPMASEAPSALYGELGLGSIKSTGWAAPGVSIRTTMIRGSIGKRFMPNFAGELMLGIGSNSRMVAYGANALPVNYEVKTLVGLYAVPQLEFGAARIFARLGVASITASPDRGLKKTSASYGFGGAYRFNDNLSFNADYMLYNKKGDVKMDGITISLGYRF